VAELLTGTATFLFTDIEGSTRLAKQLGRGYAVVLGEHQRLLRDAFTASGGRESDTQGDAFFFVFPSARGAVVAAVDGQHVISSHEWPPGADVRVRMGIHTGGAALAGDRYHGVAVHRAARICAAAHGGQILLSQSTRSLLEDEEELPDVDLRDLGEHRLKGFDRPDRVYQVVAPGLESAFPQLRTEGTERAAEDARAEQLAAAGGRTVVLAQDEARSLRHSFVGTEHLLLGVLREPDGLGAQVLRSFRVSLEDVRPIVDEFVSMPGESSGKAQLTLTPRAQRVLELALAEALSLGDDVGSGHVLLGIAREDACVASQMLRGLGVNAEALQGELRGRLAPETAEPQRRWGRRLRSIWAPQKR
jgi:class 3 adenylate cyclase